MWQHVPCSKIVSSTNDYEMFIDASILIGTYNALTECNRNIQWETPTIWDGHWPMPEHCIANFPSIVVVLVMISTASFIRHWDKMTWLVEGSRKKCPPREHCLPSDTIYLPKLLRFSPFGRQHEITFPPPLRPGEPTGPIWSSEWV